MLLPGDDAARESPVLLQGVLGDELLGAAQRAVASLLQEEGEGAECGDDDPLSLCSTWWVPLAHGERGPELARPARHVVEQVIGHLCGLPLVAAAVGGNAPLLGAEWWLQEQCPGDAPKELHTDKDVLLEQPPDGTPARARTMHPRCSSVLYLSETGGPTAVFDQRKAEGRLVPPVPTAVHVASPQPGRFLMFDGRLLHGVLHPLVPMQEPTEESPRRTLLVNWWAEVPAAASPAAPRALPPELAGPVSGCPEAAATAVRPEVVGRACAFEHDAPQWRRQLAPPGLARGWPLPALLLVSYPGQPSPHQGVGDAAGTRLRGPGAPGSVEYDWTDEAPGAATVECGG